MGLADKRARLGIALVGMMLVAGFQSGCKQQQAETDPLEGYRMAVVDLQPLMALHASYPKLEQLDREIAELQAQKVELQKKSREKIVSSGGDEMEAAMVKARKKLEAERDSIEGEIASLNSRLSAQIESEMRGLQAKYEKELEDEIKRLVPEAAAPPPPLEAGYEGQIKDYMDNLALVRERNLAAKRLELEKRVGEELQGKQEEVSSQVAAYEAELSNKYQSERLNLQLTAQNATDEEAKTKAEERLSEISQEIDEAKAAKRAELEKGFSAARAEKMSQVQGELEAYQTQLNREVTQKVEQKKAELGGRVVKRPDVSPDQSAEVKAKIAEIESRMKGQLEARQADMKAQMEAKVADAKVRLTKKQDEIKASLDDLQKDIEKRVGEQLANLPKDIQDKIKEFDDKIASLQEESRKLYDSIREDIDSQVAGVAKDKNQEMVIGSYQYKDPNFPDLTDLSQVRIQTMEKKS